MDLSQVTVSDLFLQRSLDWIPTRFLLPQNDEEQEELWKKTQKPAAAGVAKKDKLQKKQIQVGVSNADLVRSAVSHLEREEGRARQAALANEILRPAAAPHRPVDVNELREKMAARITEMRARDGVAGARAERDKLLPPKAERKRLKRASQQTSEPPPNLSFGKIELGTDAQAGSVDDKKPISTKSIFNVKKLLKKAEASQDRIARLKEQGRTDIVEQEQWAAAEKKAQGDRVRDDPRKLKRALKRLEAKKKKSGDAWQERKTAVDDAKKERIDRREANIDARRNKKRRPGFEGAADVSKRAKKE